MRFRSAVRMGILSCLGYAIVFLQVAFSYAGTIEILHAFKKDETVRSLTVSGNELYGTTYPNEDQPDQAPYGSVFKVNLDDRTFKEIYRFADPKNGQGDAPNGVSVYNGVLYGTTSYGSRSIVDYSSGTVFRMFPDGRKRTIHVFEYGSFPRGDLIEVNGALYGAAYGGSKKSGFVYKIGVDGTNYGKIYSFKDDGKDAYSPSGDLIEINGAIYGTGGGGEHADEIGSGGGGRGGTVFRIARNGSEAVLHSFGGSRYAPYGAINRSLVTFNGLLYGIALSPSGGVVYSLDIRNQAFKIVHAFEKGPNDGEMLNAFTMSANIVKVGNLLYGVTNAGGKNGVGVIFTIDMNGTEKVVYDFAKEARGAYRPQQLLNVNGVIYGITLFGGHGGGTLFKFNQ